MRLRPLAALSAAALLATTACVSTSEETRPQPRPSVSKEEVTPIETPDDAPEVTVVDTSPGGEKDTDPLWQGLAEAAEKPIVRLNEEELARIRLADRKHSFYSALRQFVKSSFSPIPANLIGLPVTALIDSAAPPRVSPSNSPRSPTPRMRAAWSCCAKGAEPPARSPARDESP